MKSTFRIFPRLKPQQNVGFYPFGIIALPFQLLGRISGQKSSFFLNQGIGNIVRGLIAMEPIGGNIILYLYDHSPNIKYDIQNATGLTP